MSKSLEDRLNVAQDKLARVHGKIQRSSRLTAIIGIIAILLIGGYFIYGYIQIKSQLLDPEKLVDTVGQQIEDQLPETRKQVEATIVSSAPGLAEQISSQLVSSAPSARKMIEDYSLTRTKEVVDELTTVSEVEFQKILDDNPVAIKKAIKELSENESVSEDVMDSVEKALEGQMQYSIKEQADELLYVLKTMKDRLARLQSSKGLTEEEQLEREILLMVRRMQEDHVDVEPAAKQLTDVLDNAKGVVEKSTAPKNK